MVITLFLILKTGTQNWTPYQKNEFLFLFSTEQQEAENLGYDVAKTLHTRLMYYDLKKLTSIA